MPGTEVSFCIFLFMIIIKRFRYPSFFKCRCHGKMDNEVTPSDTLYLNNWWVKLDVYNYEEAILLQDFCERWDETSNVFGEVESLDYYPPYPDIPRFRMTDYLWGKKDWIVQLGPLTGLY